MMNFRYHLNRMLTSGFLSQFFCFTTLTVAIFIVCLLIHLLFGHPSDIGSWTMLRLFVHSSAWLNGDGFSGGMILLLVTEILGSILFSGVIVAGITNIIIQKVKAIEHGHVHYNLKNHVVIIGFDDIVPSIILEIIRDSRHKGCKVVVQTNRSVEHVRDMLPCCLSPKELRRVILVHAARLSPDALQRLHTTTAHDILIVGEQSQPNRDTTNIHTLGILAKIHKDKRCRKRKPVVVWLENEVSYAALQLNDISDEWKHFFEFMPYNFYKRWANRLLTTSSHNWGDNTIIYPELDHKGITAESDRHVHLIIIGLNQMGIAIAKETAHMMHFPNFDDKTGRNRTTITFVDDSADREMYSLLNQIPGYCQLYSPMYADLSNSYFTGYSPISSSGTAEASFIDVRFEFIKGSAESPFVREWLCRQLEDDNSIITIAICLQDAFRSLNIAMYLPDAVYTRGRDNINRIWEVYDDYKVINIFIRQEDTGDLVKAFSDAAHSESAFNRRYANIYPFGMVNGSFSLEYHSNHIAMVFNYVYDYYFNHNGALPSSLPPKDELLDLWKKLPSSLQWSNMYLADALEFKLRSIGHDFESIKTVSLNDKQIEQLARAEHNRWDMEKLLLGYRPLDKDERNYDIAVHKQLKERLFAHHLIVPYDQLNEAEKDLDRNIILKLPEIMRLKG